MNKTIKIIALVILVLTLIGGGVYYYMLKNIQAKIAAIPDMSVRATETALSTKLTLADIAPHNTASDCWSAINGKVYNLTPFIPIHPGGQAIVKACGKDGSALFNNEEGHANPQTQVVLDKLLVGILAS